MGLRICGKNISLDNSFKIFIVNIIRICRYCLRSYGRKRKNVNITSVIFYAIFSEFVNQCITIFFLPQKRSLGSDNITVTATINYLHYTYNNIDYSFIT